MNVRITAWKWVVGKEMGKEVFGNREVRVLKWVMCMKRWGEIDVNGQD